MTLETVYRLRQEIGQHFPSLGKWQVVGLAIACMGLLIQQHCGLMRMAEAVPEIGNRQSIKQRLKRWVKNERIAVLPACYDWIRWVWSSWRIARPVLLVDESKLSDRIGVMMVSIAYEGRAIPLVWRCYLANDADAYPQQGQVLLIYGLLAHVLNALPSHVRPLVEMDRGLAHSAAMLRALQTLPVDFLVRVKQTARFTSRNGRSHLLSQLVKPGECLHLHGTLFARDHQVGGTLCLIWEVGQAQAWCLFTNVKRWLGHRYALRWWQEESFKDLKSGGWQWESSHIRCPRRMERLLLAMAVAYGWMLSLGAELTADPEQHNEVSNDDLQRLSLFRLGLAYFRRLFYLAPHRLQVTLCFAPPALRHCT